MCGDTLVKHFNVIMAGLISGIVALFTSWLGISGTVIGSVLSSFLYQFLSSYSAEKYEERIEDNSTNNPKNIGREIVYVFPIVVITIIELIFVFSALHYKFDMLFDLLEAAVFDNLFRLMGLSLIALGVYPLVSSTDIDKINGKILLVVGIFLFIRGMVDVTDLTLKLHNMFFSQFDFYFAVLVVLALVFVIVNVLRNSTGHYIFNESKNDYEIINDSFRNKQFPKPKKSKARKIDTSFYNAEEYNNHYSNSSHNSNNDFNNGLSQGSNYNSDYSSDYSSDYNPNNYSDNNSSGYSEPLNDYSNQNPNQMPIQEDLPIYEEEIIYVNNPEDPNNPIKKRILKRVSPGSSNDDYDETYIVDNTQN